MASRLETMLTTMLPTMRNTMLTTMRNTITWQSVRNATTISLLLAALLLPAARAEARQDTLALAMRSFGIPRIPRIPRISEPALPRFRDAGWDFGELSKLPVAAGRAGWLASGHGARDAWEDWGLIVLVVLAVPGAYWFIMTVAVPAAKSDRNGVGSGGKRVVTRSPPSSGAWVSSTIRRPDGR